MFALFVSWASAVATIIQFSFSLPIPDPFSFSTSRSLSEIQKLRRIKTDKALTNVKPQTSVGDYYIKTKDARDEAGSFIVAVGVVGWGEKEERRGEGSGWREVEVKEEGALYGYPCTMGRSSSSIHSSTRTVISETRYQERWDEKRLGGIRYWIRQLRLPVGWHEAYRLPHIPHHPQFCLTKNRVLPHRVCNCSLPPMPSPIHFSPLLRTTMKTKKPA